MNKFLKQEYDKFKDKTTIKLVNPIAARPSKHATIYCSEDDTTVDFRHISTPEFKSLVIDLKTITSRDTNLCAGKLWLIIDDNQRYTLEANENYTDSFGESLQDVSCFYEVSTELLKSICDAKSIEIRLTAQSDAEYADFSIPKFQWAACVMYNEIVDNTAYNDVIQQGSSINPFEKSENAEPDIEGLKKKSVISLWLISASIILCFVPFVTAILQIILLFFLIKIYSEVKRIK